MKVLLTCLVAIPAGLYAMEEIDPSIKSRYQGIVSKALEIGQSLEDEKKITDKHGLFLGYKRLDEIFKGIQKIDAQLETTIQHYIKTASQTENVKNAWQIALSEQGAQPWAECKIRYLHALADIMEKTGYYVSRRSKDQSDEGYKEFFMLNKENSYPETAEVLTVGTLAMMRVSQNILNEQIQKS